MTQYDTELTVLWQELDHSKSFKFRDAEIAEKYLKMIEEVMNLILTSPSHIWKYK